mmetsp:Transcript_109309/g.296460  ORF Transcript_109309/g.296460 Transcript_109309/m.296460 type:complete len:253 (-) Transcript_109309:83-841(-)
MKHVPISPPSLDSPQSMSWYWKPVQPGKERHSAAQSSNASLVAAGYSTVMFAQFLHPFPGLFSAASSTSAPLAKGTFELSSAEGDVPDDSAASSARTPSAGVSSGGASLADGAAWGPLDGAVAASGDTSSSADAPSSDGGVVAPSTSSAAPSGSATASRPWDEASMVTCVLSSASTANRPRLCSGAARGQPRQWSASAVPPAAAAARVESRTRRPRPRTCDVRSSRQRRTLLGACGPDGAAGSSSDHSEARS